MARECAAGKGRASVLRGGRDQDQVCPGIPDLLSDPGNPRVPTFPLAPWGLSSQPQGPSAFYGILEDGPPSMFSGPRHSRHWDKHDSGTPGHLLQEYRKLGPCPSQ